MDRQITKILAGHFKHVLMSRPLRIGVPTRLVPCRDIDGRSRSPTNRANAQFLDLLQVMPGRLLLALDASVLTGNLYRMQIETLRSYLSRPMAQPVLQLLV